jgi:hypothetical protein
MAAGLAAQRLGAESPLHFGVAPQSTAQCPSPPSRPVSFRLESTARQSRFVRPRCASRSVRYSLHPISPRHANIRIAHCRAASSALRAALAEAGALPSRPAAGPAHGMRRAPRRRTCATARQIRAWPSRVLRWRQRCGEASAQERRTRMLRSVRDPLVAATAEVQRADCALKSGR